MLSYQNVCFEYCKLKKGWQESQVQIEHKKWFKKAFQLVESVYMSMTSFEEGFSLLRQKKCSKGAWLREQLLSFHESIVSKKRNKSAHMVSMNFETKEFKPKGVEGYFHKIWAILSHLCANIDEQKKTNL